MRICFVNPVGQVGGAERVLLDAIASIRAAEPEHEIHLILMDDGPLKSAAEALGAKVLVLPAPRSIRELGDSAARGRSTLARIRLVGSMLRVAPQMRSYARTLRLAIQDLSADVVHSNGLKCHLLLSQAKLERPVVWHIHDFVGSRPMMAKLLRRFSCDATPVAVSTAVAEDIRAWLAGSSPVVVLNGIDLDRFSPGAVDGARLDELANLPPAGDQAIRIGLVATYARWKGQDIFLRAAAELVRQSPDLSLRFYVIGGAIYTTKGSQWSQSELESVVRELGLRGHVGLVPFQADPVPVYRALDVVLHASVQPEPFGLTIAEAMACGRAVIVSAQGGSAELFRDGVDAVSIPPGDVEALTTAMQMLVESPKRREAISTEARRSAVARFDRKRMGAELLAAYRNVVKRT